MGVEIISIIKRALEEDIASGDITTAAVIPEKLQGKGVFLMKSQGVAAGLNIAEEVFKILDSTLEFRKYKEDGSLVNSGSIIAEVTGNISSILTGERTALNFLQRMSGIASSAHKYASIVSHTKAKIIDTRKTAPGLRIIDKMAVRMGGCLNHRIGLYDMFLIKDNHIAAAGSISKAVEACRNHNKKSGKVFKIEVETTNLEEVSEALNSKADIIMLDNFSTDNMRKAVELINGRCKTEASGGINSETVVSVAETGVDYISIGAITHSVTAVDISLEVTRE